MSTYPTDQASRVQLRAQNTSRILAEAKAAAKRAGRSLKCGGGAGFAAWEDHRHAGQPGGCKNDGTGCLCECHDQAG